MRGGGTDHKTKPGRLVAPSVWGKKCRQTIIEVTS